MVRVAQRIRDANFTHFSRSTLSSQQQQSRLDPGPPSSAWISKVSIPAPEEADIRDALFDSIDALSLAGEEFSHSVAKPELAAVNAEWIGRRDGQISDVFSEQERFTAMMREVQNPITILYIRGGAFYLFGPARSRPSALKLSRLTKGRCLAVDYRLAPQNPFPAALLDIFIAYLSLLYPPPGSFHTAVPASSIIFAGESGGVSLCLSLIQTILTLRKLQSRNNPTLQFHDQKVEIPMPAGIAGISGGTDQTLALPSWMENAKFDWLADEAPSTRPGFRSCEIWPSTPPRAHIYCDAALLPHPLISPTAAESWEGAPPMWIASGQERLTDSVKVIAQTAAKQGVCVLWEEYEAMPHTWPMILENLPQTELCFKHCARACESFVSQGGEKPASGGFYISVEKLETRAVDVNALTSLTVEEARKLMKDKSKTGSQAARRSLKISGGGPCIKSPSSVTDTLMGFMSISGLKHPRGESLEIPPASWRIHGMNKGLIITSNQCIIK
ncbi:MAG: hypothetical protein Q9187_005579 [Circinaria calcarea]